MKKIILGGIAAGAIAVAMALNVNFSSKNTDLSDIFLANVEALAQGEWVVDFPCTIDPSEICEFLCSFGGGETHICKLDGLKNI